MCVLLINELSVISLNENWKSHFILTLFSFLFEIPSFYFTTMTAFII